MSEMEELLDDILSYSPTEKGEIRPFYPNIRPVENGLNSTLSPNSPLSPSIPLKSNSPDSSCEFETEINLKMIRAWLFKIGEPEEDHFIVLDKCKNDPEAMEYFLEHARGGLNVNSPLSESRNSDTSKKYVRI